jgi:NitT/TauT family transport system substrate-binding protein
MKKAGMLNPSTDVDALVKRSFVHLDGVSDEWLNSLIVEKVAGGQVPKSWYYREFAKNNSDAFCGLCLLPANP